MCTMHYRLIPIVERQWTDEINEILTVGSKVKARIYAIRDTEWFRFPVQLEILQPGIGDMMYACACVYVCVSGGGVCDAHGGCHGTCITGGYIVAPTTMAQPPCTSMSTIRSEKPEDHVAALDLRGKPQDFDLYLEKSGRKYVRRKYWADFEQDDMDFLRQYDEDLTDERLLTEESNWLAASDTLQHMADEGFEALVDAEGI